MWGRFDLRPHVVGDFYLRITRSWNVPVPSICKTVKKILSESFKKSVVLVRTVA
jgi:hypothetical protein